MQPELLTNMIKYLKATAAGVIVAMALGFAWYNVIGPAYYYLRVIKAVDAVFKAQAKGEYIK
jgi:endonuclease V-like protein UPF0215 family